MMKIILSDLPLPTKGSSTPTVNKAKPANREDTQYGTGHVESDEFFDVLNDYMEDLPDTQEVGDLMEALEDAKEEGDQQGLAYLMQMLAEMMAVNPILQDAVQQLSQEGGLSVEVQEILDTLSASSGAAIQSTEQPPVQAGGDVVQGAPLQNTAFQQLTQAAEQQPNAVANGRSITYGQENGTVQQSTTSQNGQALQGTGSLPLTQVEQNATGDSQGQQLMEGESTFQSAVAEAKKQMRLNANRNTEMQYAALDVDALQRHADAARISANSRAEAPSTYQPPLPTTQDIAQQVKTGIQQNTALGLGEFVVKLKPEGIGEITIRMLDNGSKVAMSILTSNTQMAKLLSGELGLLRETMRPYQVEVTEIVCKTENSQELAGQSADQQFAQSFAEQQGRQYANQNRSLYSPYYGPLAEETEESPFPQGMLQQPQSRLNTYI